MERRLPLLRNQQDVGLSDANPILPPAAGVAEGAKILRNSNFTYLIMPKGKTSKANRRMTIRFTKAEWNRLEKWLSKTVHHRNMSELLRHLIFKKELTIYTRDKNREEVLEKLVLIRNELRAIGVNINQVTRYFNTYPEPGKKERYARKIAALYQGTDSKIEDLLVLMEQLGKRWSHE